MMLPSTAMNLPAKLLECETLTVGYRRKPPQVIHLLARGS